MTKTASTRAISRQLSNHKTDQSRFVLREKTTVLRFTVYRGEQIYPIAGTCTIGSVKIWRYIDSFKLGVIISTNRVFGYQRQFSRVEVATRYNWC